MMEEAETLIELVKKYPLLYDTSSVGYKDHSKKETSWEEIGMAMLLSAEEVKKRWRLMRDNFSREVRKLKTKGCTVKENSLSKWRLFDRMLFLKDFSHPRKVLIDFTNTRDNLEDEDDEREDEGLSSVDNGCDVTTPGTSATRQTPMKRPSSSTGSEETPSSKGPRKEDDKFDYFGKYLAGEIRSIPNPVAQMKMMIEIQNLIFLSRFSPKKPATKTTKSSSKSSDIEENVHILVNLNCDETNI